MSLHAAPMLASKPPHVGDGELLRFQDAELDGREHAQVGSHLASCEPCAARYAELIAVAARLHSANLHVELPAALATPPWHQVAGEPRLSVIDGAAPRAAIRRRTFVIAMRAAVAVALVAAGTAAATPVRAWIASRRALPSVRATSPAPASARPAAPRVLDARHASSLAFVPSRSVLAIEIEANRGDSVVLRATALESAQVRAYTLGEEPTLVVMPDRLRLVSSRASSTSYEVEVPAAVSVVEVRDGRRVLARLARQELQAHEWRSVTP